MSEAAGLTAVLFGRNLAARGDACDGFEAGFEAEGNGAGVVRTHTIQI